MRQDLGKLVIFGAWYFSHVVAEAAECSGWSVAGYIDPDPPDGVSTLETIPDDAGVIAAIGDNAMRAYVSARLIEHGRNLVSIVHPSAVVSRTATIGAGCYLGENAVVRANATLGMGVFLNAGSVVSHDCRIDDYVIFGPNAATAGHVSVGARTRLGVGANVRPWVRIGCDCEIGAGAAVVGDIEDGMTAMGVPARAAPRQAKATKQSDWKTNTLW